MFIHYPFNVGTPPRDGTYRKKRTSHCCQILSPEELYVGRKVILVVHPVDSCPIRIVVTVAKLKPGYVQFNEKCIFYHEIKHLWINFAELGLRIYRTGVWNNSVWLEYPNHKNISTQRFE